MRGPPSGLLQQAGEAGGSLTLEAQGWVGRRRDRPVPPHDLGPASEAERATRVNQWLKPLKLGTGSNLMDMGRVAARAEPTQGEATPIRDT